MDTQHTILSQEQINNLPLFEFFNYCKNTPQIDNLTIYNYIQHTTNLDKNKLKALEIDLHREILSLIDEYVANYSIEEIVEKVNTYQHRDKIPCRGLTPDTREALMELKEYKDILNFELDLRAIFFDDIYRAYFGLFNVGMTMSSMELWEDKDHDFFYHIDLLKYGFWHTSYEDLPLEVKTIIEEFNTSKIEENRNQKTKEQKHSTPHLSKKLDTKQFKQVLKKAIDKGLIEINDDRYVWKGTKTLFGYFVEEMNDYLKLRHGEKKDLKSFAETFDIPAQKISSAMQEYKKTGLSPIGHENIKILKC